MNRTRRIGFSDVTLNLILLAVGICMIALPELSAKLLCGIVGAVFLVLGAASIFSFMKGDRAEFFFRSPLPIGLMLVIAGLVLIFRPVSIINALNMIVGIYVIITACFMLQAAIELKRLAVADWIPCIVVAILGLVLGRLLVLRPFESAKALTTLSGIALVLDSIAMLYGRFAIRRAIKNGSSVTLEYFIR